MFVSYFHISTQYFLFSAAAIICLVQGAINEYDKFTTFTNQNCNEIFVTAMNRAGNAKTNSALGLTEQQHSSSSIENHSKICQG